jgi:hypothetical protein
MSFKPQLLPKPYEKKSNHYIESSFCDGKLKLTQDEVMMYRLYGPDNKKQKTTIPPKK